MKSLILTSLLGAVIVFVSTVLVLSTESWAPATYKMFESMGNYRFKPWGFFLPGFLVNLLIVIINPSFRNGKSVIALFLGGALLAVVLVAVIYMVAYSAMPNLRY